jgi:hypothetical protein
MPKKYRSFLEVKDLPLAGLTQGSISLASVLKTTKYEELSDDDKRDVIVVKEAFALLDPKQKKVGVFTRSDKDHGTKIGQCSTLLCSNFDVRECTVTNDADIIYDAHDRLHANLKEISGLFTQVKKKSIPAVYYEDTERGKRYLFLLFELTCNFDQLSLCYHLDSRRSDMFIGMRDIKEVSRGLHKFNKSSFDVDKALVDILKSKGGFFGGKFSFAEKLIEAKLASFTLVKFQLIGV